MKTVEGGRHVQYCKCGGELDVYANPAVDGAAIARMWLEQHQTADCGPCDRRTAARARRRHRRKAVA